jgi:hypothetical protein
MKRTLTQTKNRLIQAMGLTPAAITVALSGCAVEQVVLDLDDEGFEHQLATSGEGASQVPPPGDLDLVVRDIFEAGVSNVASISGADPNTRVYLIVADSDGLGPCPPVLNGVCVDLVMPRVLGSVVANASGVANIPFILPYDIPEGAPRYLQAAGPGVGYGDTSNVWAEDVRYPPRVCGDYPWLTSPAIFGTYLACSSLPSSGVCPDATNVPGRALYRRAVGQPAGSFTFPYVMCLELSVEDACCYSMDVSTAVPGRPFRVGGEMRVSQQICDEGWSSRVDLGLTGLNRRARRRLAHAWGRQGQAEHASVAAFARFVLQLMQLGAPAALVAEAGAAMSDEIVHARDSFSVASAFAGEPVGAGPLDTHDALEADDLKSILLDVVREGCINETIAASQAAVARDACQNEAIRRILTRIADDEARHAALAWKFVQWALEQHPELAETVREVFAEGWMETAAPFDPMARTLRAHGVLSEPEMQHVARRVFHDVIAPCATAMLGVPVGMGLAA